MVSGIVYEMTTSHIGVEQVLTSRNHSRDPGTGAIHRGRRDVASASANTAG